jgi:poly(hydroxyalkanoate) depolymerase family esterase
MSWKHILLIIAMATILLGPPPRAQAGDWVSGSASNSAGTRNYQLWVPSGQQNNNKGKPVSLVMMLHGCMQTPQDLAAISGMNSVADKNNFLVVYPEQTKEANPLRCWNWFDSKHQARDSGEPSLLAAIVSQVGSTYNIDAQRVYVAGISAGGAMAVVTGATYPDVFSGIGVSSGLAFKAGSDVQSGLAAMKQGAADPKQLGLEAFKSMRESWADLPALNKRRMPVIVFHGDADPYLNPVNADQLIAQWAKANDYLDDGKDNDSVKAQPSKTIEGSVPEGRSYTKSIYKDGASHLLMEKWIVKGMGHAWSGSPVASPFADPKGPNASEEMWRFFRETTLGSGSSKPKAAKPRGRAK